ncbi:hypothetical protein C8R44DRAFT_740548 [Mycena epipterygia]|nr:hypothetical protein C8R44DRAFT_740548 [Mycena epipterygia]
MAPIPSPDVAKDRTRERSSCPGKDWYMYDLETALLGRNDEQTMTYSTHEWQCDSDMEMGKVTLDVEQDAKNGELLDGGAACECGSLFGKVPSKWRSATDDRQTSEKRSWALLLPLAPTSFIAGTSLKDAWWTLLNDSRILRTGGDSLAFPQDDVYGGSRWVLWQGVGSGMFSRGREGVRGSHVRRENMRRINKGRRYKKIATVKGLKWPIRSDKNRVKEPNIGDDS